MAQEICPICRSGIRQDSDHCTVCGYEKSIDFLRYRTLQNSRDEDLLEWEICARRAEMQGLMPAPIPGRKPKREELRQSAAPAGIPFSSPVEDFKYEIIGNSVSITKYIGKDTEVSIPSTIEGKPVTSIGADAFSECGSLREITIHAGVTSIGDDTISFTMSGNVISIGVGAFSGCSSLNEIRVASGNPEFCSVDGVLFSKNGKEIRAYPGGRTGAYTIPAGVTSIGKSAFCGCSSLSGITIPAGVTTIGFNAFGVCSSLREIMIPAGVTTIGGHAFYGCSSLSELMIPAGVTSIGNDAFFLCGCLSEITIPAGVTSIGNDAFYGCKSLRKITIPDSVTSVGRYAFFRCSSLSEITIPAGITSIRDSAFCGCSSLYKITIPASVMSIEENAFNGCSSLTDVYYGGTESQWNTIRIGERNNRFTNAKIHISDRDKVTVSSQTTPERKPARKRGLWPIIIVLAAAAVLIFELVQRGELPWPVQTAAPTALSTAVPTDIKSDGVMSYAEYIAAEDGAQVSVEAFVQGSQSWWDNKINVYAQDLDGGYFFYQMNCSEEDAAKLVRGTKIRATGYKAVWAGEVEIIDASFEFEDGYYIAPAADISKLLGNEDVSNYMNEFISVNGGVIADKGDGAAFYYNWNNSGEDGSDLYFDVILSGQIFTFIVESELCGPGSEVYETVKSLQIGDQVNLEGFLYWYEGPNPHVTKCEISASSGK